MSDRFEARWPLPQPAPSPESRPEPEPAPAPAPAPELELEGYERPRVRADCLEGGINEQRPCPWVSCRYHLALDINPESGSVKLIFPEKEVWELEETCALDAANSGPLTLEQVGHLANVTRERIRQVETKAFKHTRKLVRSVAPDLIPEAELADVPRRPTIERTAEVRPEPERTVAPEIQAVLERLSQRSTRQTVVRREVERVPSAVESLVRAVEASPERAPDVTLYGWDCPDHGAPPQLSPDEGRAPPPEQEEVMSEETKDAVRKWLGSKKAPRDWFAVADVAASPKLAGASRASIGAALGALAEEGLLEAEGERSQRRYRLVDLGAEPSAGEEQEQAGEEAGDDAPAAPAPERRRPGPKPKVIGAADILAALPQLNVKDLVEIRTQMQAILSSKVAELEQQLAEAKAAIGVAAP